MPAVLLAAACGCALSNGLPGDVEALLADSGIVIHVLEEHAPFDSRAGFVRISRDEVLEAMIVEAFDMTPVDLHDPLPADLAERAGETPVAIWGVTGSPELLLEDGGRFLYLYLMVTDDGRAFIFAEYAYG